MHIACRNMHIACVWQYAYCNRIFYLLRLTHKVFYTERGQRRKRSKTQVSKFLHHIQRTVKVIYLDFCHILAERNFDKYSISL